MKQPGKFLTAEWRSLAMLNYQVDAAILKPHVPAGTELDSFDGVFYISMIGFMFQRTRVLGAPIPGHQDFEEVNLRFYVRRRDEDGWKRGVVFLKEIVPKYAIAALARGLYNENYVSMPMRHRADGNRVEYGWLYSGNWNRLGVEIAGEPGLAAPGSLEAFITEHYWGYTKQRDGGSLEYHVEHVPWRLWQTSRAQLLCDAVKLYGPEFAEALGVAPESAFLAEGSAVAVHRGVRII
jgi:uncharacterized protein YqjF (DUF2071 family)